MIVIEGGTVIDPATAKDGEFDLLVKDGVVAEVSSPGAFAELTEADRIDASGRWVVPGLVDIHVHLREPGEEWKETVSSGCRAAVLGGYTSICAMPNTRPSNHCAETTRYILEKAEQARAARVFPIGAVSIDLLGKNLAPLSELHKAGCVAFSDDGEPVWNSGLMRRALEWSKMLGLPISCHEEDKSLSCGGCMNESPLSTRMGLRGMPAVAEEVMIARDIELARTTGGHVHFCHVSSARGVELIRRAKSDGIAVTAEVTPHHLLLNEQSVSTFDTAYKMSPPLREEHDRLGLVEGLRDGTLDAIASDHAPHEFDKKNIEFAEAAFGILGLQTSLPLILEFVHTGVISRTRAVEVLTTLPSRIFNLPGGQFSAGAPADIAIIDPAIEWTFEKSDIESLSKNSPFVGRPLKGKPVEVLVGGERRVVEGKIR